MRLPKRIKLGVHTYTVRLVGRVADYYNGKGSHKKDEELDGLHLPDKDMILLAKNLNASGRKVTLMHECIHSIEEHWGIKLTENEVRALAEGTCELFDNNPPFTRLFLKTGGS